MSAAATVRERPILFSGPMVRAILDGTQTQTRRVVKRQPITGEWIQRADALSPGDTGFIYAMLRDSENAVLPCPCPYGQPGDRLWVRETWNPAFADAAIYRADYGHRLDLAPDYQPGGGWKPSIHMPRRFSRLTLEITAVRVERVQDISPVDCAAEGLTDLEGNPWAPSEAGEVTAHGRDVLRAGYWGLWDSLNAARGFGWTANPWVWVLEFAAVRA